MAETTKREKHVTTSQLEHYTPRTAVKTNESSFWEEEAGSEESHGDYGVPKDSLILVPNITEMAGLARKRKFQYLRIGYYRNSTIPFPSRNHIELTQDDLLFITFQKNKFLYDDYYLLCPDRLLRSYAFFAKLKHQKYQKRWLQDNLEICLLDFEEERLAAIFEHMRQDCPNLFQRFTSMLVERWLYRCKVGNIFKPNSPSRRFSNVVPYSLKTPYRVSKSKYPSTALKMRTHLHKIMTKNSDLLLHHSQTARQFSRSKRLCLNSILTFLRYLTLFSEDIEFQPIMKNQSQVTMLQIEKKLFSVHSEIKRWKQSQSLRSISLGNSRKSDKILINAGYRSNEQFALNQSLLI